MDYNPIRHLIGLGLDLITLSAYYNDDVHNQGKISKSFKTLFIASFPYLQTIFRTNKTYFMPLINLISYSLIPK